MRAFYWTDEGLQNFLSAKGWPHITRAQSIVFVNIGEGITRPSEIAARVGVSRQAIHQTLSELVELGYMKLVPDPDDGRAKIIKLTARGERLGHDAVESLCQIEQALAQRIGAKNVKAMKAALARPWGEPVNIEVIE